jgi:hypothetical protein
MIASSVIPINDVQSAAATLNVCEVASVAKHGAKSLQVSRLCRVLVCSRDAAEMLAPFVFGESRAS